MTSVFSKEELSKIFSKQIQSGINDVCINSNDAKFGDLFVALKGKKTDGHKFVKQAIDNGAILAIVEEDIDGIDEKKLVKVESSYKALLELAKYNIEKTNARYIGITGSVGKTTTKDMIYHILSQFPDGGNIHATRKNFNSQIGLPICVATMPRNTKIGIFEMGMSNFGDIKKLINIVPPAVSIISGICETHLEFFDSVWDICKAKAEIFETLIPQEFAIIPADSPYTVFLENRARKCGVQEVFSFGFQKSDAHIISYNYVDEGISIVMEILGEKIEYRIRCYNDSCILNSASAILAAYAVSKIQLQELADVIGSFLPSQKRGENIFFKERNLIVVDDSYNACPTSVRAAIKSLSRYKTRRKILVIGDMLELGLDSVHYHENLSATIDKFGIDLVFACGKFSLSLFNNLVDSKKGAWRENSLEISKKVLNEIHDGDCILVKGSNSMGMSLVVETIRKWVNHVL
ncbi:MAG: UDP-N-acetylmuramoyl-tripeptide--D-alanyl-D-alanine ligase [Holosporaceae bacterium]|jgi:UDP-N-acetylmuramoyl-tripeptide--D-alanyl-D-alanine ligase|nr:UDP-N-acetylmuramoyl-tripeptide--D-alanyl-D-alanine ligase [Holosporaceae bacterium]